MTNHLVEPYCLRFSSYPSCLLCYTSCVLVCYCKLTSSIIPLVILHTSYYLFFLYQFIILLSYPTNFIFLQSTLPSPNQTPRISLIAYRTFLLIRLYSTLVIECYTKSGNLYLFNPEGTTITHAHIDTAPKVKLKLLGTKLTKVCCYIVACL